MESSLATAGATKDRHVSGSGSHASLSTRALLATAIRKKSRSNSSDSNPPPFAGMANMESLQNFKQQTPILENVINTDVMENNSNSTEMFDTYSSSVSMINNTSSDVINSNSNMDDTSNLGTDSSPYGFMEGNSNSGMIESNSIHGVTDSSSNHGIMEEDSHQAVVDGDSNHGIQGDISNDALMNTNSNQSVMEEISSQAIMETDLKEVKSISSKTSEDDFNNVTLESKTNCSGSVSKPDTPEQQQANSPPASHQPESPVNDHLLDQSSKDDSPKPTSFEFEDQDSPPANVDNVSNKPSTTEPAANSAEPAGKNLFFQLTIMKIHALHICRIFSSCQKPHWPCAVQQQW